MITANLRRPVGRPRGPTKLTPELMARTFELVEAGMNLDGVAYSVGINPTTFYRWMREGRYATEGPYYEFFAGVKKGLATFGFFCFQQVASGRRDWRRYAWLLERKFPDRWGRRRLRMAARPRKRRRTMEELVAEAREKLGSAMEGPAGAGGRQDPAAKVTLGACRAHSDRGDERLPARQSTSDVTEDADGSGQPAQSQSSVTRIPPPPPIELP